LLYGAGVKGKVLDCIAAGVPAVLSPAAAEALPLTHGSEAFIAETAAQWADAVALLYRDENIWKATSEAALALTARRYSFARGREIMSAALEKVGLYVEQDRSALCVSHTRPPMRVLVSPAEMLDIGMHPDRT
jgi:glycosyltransferase involved in cell wall biosynthesis